MNNLFANLPIHDLENVLEAQLERQALRDREDLQDLLDQLDDLLA